MNKYSVFLILLIGIMTKKSEAQNALQTKQIYMYSNGYAFIVKAGKVNLTNGKFSLVEKEIPKAIFGSLWFSAANGIDVIKRQNDTVMRKIFTPGIEQLLKNNIGKNVALNLRGNPSQRIEGTITKYFEIPQNSEQQYVDNPAIIQLKTKTGNTVIYRNTIAEVIAAEFGDDAKMEITDKYIQNNLQVSIKGAPKTADVSMAYLEQGKAWTPNYRLELLSDKKARLTLAAEMSSPSADISNIDLNLVMGSPDFSQGTYLSRLVDANVAAPILYEAEKTMYNVRSNKAIMADDAGSGPVSVSQSQNNDFIIYTIKGINLVKNQDAWIQILQADLDINHTYETDFGYVNEYSAPSNNPDGNNFDVWHKIGFLNTSKQPLVSGPIFIENFEAGKEVVLGQPILSQTLNGAKASITLSQNLDVIVTKSETEINRKPQAKTISYPNGGAINFDLVSVKNTVNLENNGKKEIKVIIKQMVEGIMQKSDVSWQLKTMKPRSGSVNDVNYVSWEITLKPGEKKTFNYTYDYFFRSGY